MMKLILKQEKQIYKLKRRKYSWWSENFCGEGLVVTVIILVMIAWAISYSFIRISIC